MHRWCGFAALQKRVARRFPDLLTVSSTSAADIADDFGSIPASCPWCRSVSTQPVRLMGMPAFRGASSRSRSRRPSAQGTGHLQAVAELRVKHDIELQLVCKAGPNRPTEAHPADLSITGIIHTASGLTDSSWRACSPRPRCVFPSLYEGFFAARPSEAMASATPIVASRTDAPEVLGSGGECARTGHTGRCRRN